MFYNSQIVVHPVPDTPLLNEVCEYLGRASHQVPCLNSAFWL